MASDLAHAYDEARNDDGEPRGSYAALLEALDSVELGWLSTTLSRRLEQERVLFGAETFVADPVPRLLAAAEWDPLAAGLAQRTIALNRFLVDAYGEQRVVREGVIPAATIEQAEGYEPDLRGRLGGHTAPAAIIGFDVVRHPNGEFLVLEDNVRTPSGFAYALAVRRALIELLSDAGLTPRPIEPVTYELLERVLRAAAPRGVPDPTIVVLTDGPSNVAHFEHACAARRLGGILAGLDDLCLDGSRLLVRLPDGGQQAVDVVYRRTNEDRARDETGQLTPVAEALLEPWLKGQIGLVNAFGNGLADDKLVHAHVEDFVRFYLGEEPLIGSVPTSELRTAEDAETTITVLRSRVVKPRHGHGGNGVVIGTHAEDDELAVVTAELRADPGRFISQPIVALSRHPTVIEGRLEPRHVDLRPFAFCAGDDVALMPGGLSRVALEQGGLIVNSSQDGGGKDTWVID
jgi:uncharacterized circularly permuted ATP-grasp superfamily protein